MYSRLRVRHLEPCRANLLALPPCTFTMSLLPHLGLCISSRVSSSRAAAEKEINASLGQDQLFLFLFLISARPTCPVDAGKRLKVRDGPGQDVLLVERGEFCWDVAIRLQVSPGPVIFTNRVISHQRSAVSADKETRGQQC